MQILWIVAGIIVLAVIASVVFRYSDKWRIERKKAAVARDVRQIVEAREYLQAHALLTTAIRQSSEGYLLEARLLQARLIRAVAGEDSNELVAMRQAIEVFLEKCQGLIDEIGAAIDYDHKHFKKLAKNYQKEILEPHERWHAHLNALKNARAEVSTTLLSA